MYFSVVVQIKGGPISFNSFCHCTYVMINLVCYCCSRVLIAGAAASTSRAIIETPLELAKVEL